MKKILLGGLAAIIGVAGISTFFYNFLGILVGGLPLILILGGALAFYLGFTEVQESKKENTPEPETDIVSTTAPEPVVQETVVKDPDTEDKATENTVTEETITEDPVESPVTEDSDKEMSESVPPAEQETEQPAETRFKGNAETLVFHGIDCKFSQGKKCTAEFSEREEAVAQGYKPCKVCNP